MHSLPRIEDTLDGLNSVVWLTALDLLLLASQNELGIIIINDIHCWFAQIF